MSITLYTLSKEPDLVKSLTLALCSAALLFAIALSSRFGLVDLGESGAQFLILAVAAASVVVLNGRRECRCTKTAVGE